MTFRGTIKNGRVELERGADLPDGTVVNVEPVRGPRAKKSVYHLYDLATSADQLPVDYAKELDHDLYGAPKRNRGRGTKKPAVTRKAAAAVKSSTRAKFAGRKPWRKRGR